MAACNGKGHICCMLASYSAGHLAGLRVGIMVIAGEGSKILTGGCIEAAPANKISGRTPRIMTEVRLRAESVTRQWSAFGMVEFTGAARQI